VWSVGATTWELAHGDPPFEDVQDMRDIVGAQLPPVRQPEAFSRSFHDFLHSCSQPAASRPDPDELLEVRSFSSILMEDDLLIKSFKFCRRPTSYGLRVHAQRLSGCWDSAGQLMSSRFFGRVTNSDFHLFKKIRRFLHLHISHSFHPPPITLPNPKCLVGYTTNIIQLLLFLFPYTGHQGHLPTAAACHVMLPSTICVIRFSVLLSIYKTMAREHFRKVFFSV
jgi:hypothetical protein